ncbi:hypothetical protein E2C01_097566 [Portunus trituberculatus]|uniref:Uncharacterized protein n=1 Tax=Portunus trituberculatus TaxID=210409 RepID=A0A5B7JVI9_PORTR|nr:hypothetical protein [Portunus trituberculatus]
MWRPERRGSYKWDEGTILKEQANFRVPLSLRGTDLKVQQAAGVGTNEKGRRGKTQRGKEGEGKQEVPKNGVKITTRGKKGRREAGHYSSIVLSPCGLRMGGEDEGRVKGREEWRWWQKIGGKDG